MMHGQKVFGSWEAPSQEKLCIWREILATGGKFTFLHENTKRILDNMMLFQGNKHFSSPM